MVVGPDRPQLGLGLADLLAELVDEGQTRPDVARPGLRQGQARQQLPAGQPEQVAHLRPGGRR